MACMRQSQGMRPTPVLFFGLADASPRSLHPCTERIEKPDKSPIPSVHTEIHDIRLRLQEETTGSNYRKVQHVMLRVFESARQA